MIVKKGIPVSPGVCIGEVAIVGREDLVIRRRSVEPGQVQGEIDKLDVALRRVIHEIEGEMARLDSDLWITRQILATHRDMVADPSLREEVVVEISRSLSTAEQALSVILKKYYRRFESMASQYLSERAQDLADIEKKLLRALLGRDPTSRGVFPENSVIVGQNLSPAETASLDRDRVIGFAIDVGGRTSHTAIMARAMQIPAVVGLKDISTCVSGGETVVIDGYSGSVILDPDEATLEVYRRKARFSETLHTELRGEVRLPSETIDGYEVTIAANIELPEEIPNAIDWGASGIGLYRTEFLYDGTEPDEEKQFATYRDAVLQLGGRYLVLRTLDLGADKFHKEAVGHAEANPFLGCRSIRLCFQRPEIFRTQLRAIYRASAFGPIRLMLPMVSSLDELRRAKSMIQNVQDDLLREGIPLDSGIPIGIMVEVPSTALLADVFAREVDFFSVGTNDLVQYCLAVDRVNERVAHLYQPAHPSILRLVKTVVEAGRRQGIDVSICGEMSSEPAYTLLLLGMGLRSFSVSPIGIPIVKRLVRGVSMKDAAEVARTCLRYETAEECQAFLDNRVRKFLPANGV